MANVNAPIQKVPLSLIDPNVPPQLRGIFEDLFNYLTTDQFFEHQLWKRTGAGTDIIDNSVNISNSVASTTTGYNARIGEIQKQLLNQPVPDNVLPRIQALSNELVSLRNVSDMALLPRIQEVLIEAQKHTQDDLTWRPRLVGVSKRLSNVENSQPQDNLARINQLIKQNSNQEQLINSLLTQIARLNSLANTLSIGIPLNQIEATTEYDQTKFDDVVYCDATSGAFDVNLIDPTLAFKPFTVTNVTGTAVNITVAAAVGTIVGTTTISDTESMTYFPRKSASEWRDS